MMFQRCLRRLAAALALATSILISACAGVAPTPAAAPAAATARATLDPFFADLEERTFRFFWDTTNAVNGLVPDRYPTPSFSSIAAVGFGLTSYPIGVERGYVTRAAARDRVLATLRFFRNAPQGPAARGMAGHKGFFYRYLDMNTGERFQDIELSTVDTSLLLGGILFCQSYFDGADAGEAEIRQLADEIYRRVDWKWAQARPPAISHGWMPESGMIKYDWKAYNEAMLVYILALGSPTHPVASEAWGAWSEHYDQFWRTSYGQQHLVFAPHFGHQYTHVWVDLRKVQDAYMRRRGIDYFENSRRATYAQQAYAIENPLGCKDYGANVWGLTASDGPVNMELPYNGSRIPFRTYAARGIGGLETYDDCTIAPTAAVASLPFAPEIVIPATLEMNRRYGGTIYSTYGFLDAFNPSFHYDVPLQNGRRVAGFGWVNGDYIGIDQGPILAMVENYRSDLVWRTMRKNPYLRNGLVRAGFSGGWLDSEK